MAELCVMGIDPSLCGCAVMVLDADGVILANEIIKSSPSGGMVGNRMARIHEMVGKIKAIVDVFIPTAICLEGYSLGSNMPGVSDRVEFGGLLRYVLWRSERRVIEVPPTTLKKFVTGKGAFPGGGKVPLIVALTSKYGVQFKSDDAYDAYGLARLAMMIAKFDEPTNDIQRSTIQLVTTEKVKKPRAKKVKS